MEQIFIGLLMLMLFITVLMYLIIISSSKGDY